MGIASAAQKLRSARDEIARVAARWQANGHDTSPLAEPLVRIQEAIAEIELSEAQARRAAADYFAPAAPPAARANITPTDG